MPRLQGGIAIARCSPLHSCCARHLPLSVACARLFSGIFSLAESEFSFNRDSSFEPDTSFEPYSSLDPESSFWRDASFDPIDNAFLKPSFTLCTQRKPMRTPLAPIPEIFAFDEGWRCTMNLRTSQCMLPSASLQDLSAEHRCGMDCDRARGARAPLSGTSITLLHAASIQVFPRSLRKQRGNKCKHAALYRTRGSSSQIGVRAGQVLCRGVIFAMETIS